MATHFKNKPTEFIPDYNVSRNILSLNLYIFFCNKHFFTWRSHQDANWVYMPIMYVYYEIWLHVDSITQLSSTKALRRVRSW